MKMKSTLIAALFMGLAAPALAGGKIYVPMGGADQVLVIDTALDKVVGKIVGTKAAHGLAGVPGGKFLVAGSFEELDPTKSGVPQKPQGMSEDEHGSHHAKRTQPAAADSDSVSAVSIIRISDNKVVRRITVPGAVHHVETTPDGRHAVVTHPNTDSVSIIDLEKFEVTKTIRTGPTPNYVVAARTGSNIYVSNSGNDTISEIDITSGAVLRNIAVGKSPEHMVLSPDGGTLYVANADGGTVSRIALDRGAVGRTYAIGGGLHGLDISDDGKTLFVAARETNKLVAVDLASGKVRAGALAPQPYHLAAVPGTGKLYVSSAGEDKIWVVGQTDLRARKTIAMPDRAHQIAVFK